MKNFRTPRRGEVLARVTLALNLTFAADLGSAQPITTLPSEGVAARPSRHIVLTHARIVTEPGMVIEGAASAVAYGLSKAEARKAIMLYPAQLLGVADRVGTIDIGRDTTVFLTDGDPMDARSTVERAWIGGREIDLANHQTRINDRCRQKYPQTRDAR